MRINAKERGRLRLADFHRRQLAPAIVQAQYAITGKTRSWIENILLCSFFEAISWIGLGAECEYFPKGDAQRILETYHMLLRQSVSLYREGNFSMFTPGLESYVFGLASDANLSSHQIGDESPEENHQAFFGASLFMSSRLLKDRLAETASSFLTFMPQFEWERILRGELSPQIIEQLLLGEGDLKHQSEDDVVTLDTLTAGTIRLLEHMARSARFFGSSREHISDDFVRLLGMPQAWRLKLTDPEIRNRYNDMGECALVSVRSERDRSEPFEDSLRFSISYLAEAWIRNHPLWRTAATA